jgi:hypothetical protein
MLWKLLWQTLGLDVLISTILSIICIRLGVPTPILLIVCGLGGVAVSLIVMDWVGNGRRM